MQGDEVAQEIVARAAAELCHSVKNAALKSALCEVGNDAATATADSKAVIQGGFKVVVSGGVLQSDSPVLEALIARLRKSMPSAEV